MIGPVLPALPLVPTARDPEPPEPRSGRRPRDIGTSAETAVVRYLRANGFPHAERRALKGSRDEGDITGTPGVVWEVKGGETAKTMAPGSVVTWLKQTETERVNARADIGVLVMQRRGFGHTRTGAWWAVLPGETTIGIGGPVFVSLAMAATWLRGRGYGDPL